VTGGSRALRRLSLVATAALLALSGVALAEGITDTRLVNLDADPALEQVIPQEVCTALTAVARASTCSPDQYPQRRIVIEDTCNGAPSPAVVSSIQDTVDVLRIENFENVTDRPEIFFDMRSGASGRVGDTRLLRWGDASDAACPRVRTLFRYPSARTRGRVPRGAAYHDSYSVRLRDFSKRFAGKEIRLTESYVDRNDPFCCPSFKRTTFFGYSVGKDTYVRYRTRVKRIRK
jgi:hypothetical protein